MRMDRLARSALLGAIFTGLAAHFQRAAAAPAAQAPVETLDRLLALLASPDVAYLLLVVGLLGIVAEIGTAGSVFPGVTGAICLLLSLYGLLNLPTNWIGAALIVAGVVMFLLDIKVAGFALSIGAVVAFGLGSLMLFTPFWVVAPEAAVPVARLNPWVILGTTSGVSVFFLLGLSAAVRAHLKPVAMGQETLTGRTGTVRVALSPQGIVHIDGEEWSAISASGAELPAGTRVRVLETDGLTLKVEPVEHEGA